jgi:uncharacterized protein
VLLSAASLDMTACVSDPRFVEGVRLFNQREFFACHDELEEVWSETLGEDRRFCQGLIHAAVALHHFEEGNLGGARKMYASTRRYLQPYVPEHAGIDLQTFLERFEVCFADLCTGDGEYPHGVSLDLERVPRITLNTATASTEVPT